MKTAKSEIQHKHAPKGAQHRMRERKINAIIAQNTKHQASFRFTHSEGPTRPSSTKRGYMISHSDLSKSATESDPPRSVGVARARLASILVFQDFLREALVNAVVCHRGFIDEAA
jgi:hypothetical protein